MWPLLVDIMDFNVQIKQIRDSFTAVNVTCY